MKNQFYGAGLAFQPAAFADVDPNNTLLWNRENAMAGNAKSTAILGRVVVL